jgi:hypothetical protein
MIVRALLGLGSALLLAWLALIATRLVARPNGDLTRLTMLIRGCPNRPHSATRASWWRSQTVATTARTIHAAA